MKFKTAEETKKWLRGLPLLKKEIEMKTAFYQDLIKNSKRMGKAGEKHIAYYEKQVDALQEKMKELTLTFEKLLNGLDPDERAVLTARYVKCLLWDAMEFHVHFSRRQAVRIHNQALERLIGFEIGAVAA